MTVSFILIHSHDSLRRQACHRSILNESTG